MTDFVDSLDEYCQKGESGVFHFISEDEHAGRILIKEGHIVGLRYYSKKGVKVIESLQSMEKVSYRVVSKDIKSPKDNELPETLIILTTLNTCLA